MENGSLWTAPTASEARELFSGRECAAHNAHFTGLSALKMTTMRRTIWLQIRPMQALLARILPAMIVEWLFSMQIDEVPACLQRTPPPRARCATEIVRMSFL